MKGEEAMRKPFILALLLALGVLGWAQAEFTDFPVGRTEMVWTLRGFGPAQGLHLVVEKSADGLLRVQMSLSLEGTAEQLAGLGFFGAPLLIQAMGSETLDLSALSVLVRRREALEVGERYALPGGEFLARQKGEIAGVLCLIGEFRPAGRPETVIEVGLSLSDPVYLLPLLRVREGEKIAFEMLLVEYSRP